MRPGESGVAQKVVQGKATVVVAAEAHEKIEHYVDLCHGECSWVGEMKLTKEGEVFVARVAEIDFLKQWCTGGNTYIDPVWKAEWMERHGYVDGEQTPQMYLYWGHSHVMMPTFWSGTDEECIRSFLNFTGQGALASVVYNKRGEWKARLDYNVKTRMLGQDREVQGTIEADMDVEGVDFGTREVCEREVKELVTIGMAPQRDLSDDRLAALEEEDKAKGRRGMQHWGQGWHPSPTGHGMVYRPSEVGEGSRALVVYKDGDAIFEDDDEMPYGRKTRLVGDTQVGWIYCRECKVKEYCATQIINQAEMGCKDREKLLVVSGLEKKHFKEAKQRGRGRELQAWRDRRKAELKERGEAVGTRAMGTTVTGYKFCKESRCVTRLWPENEAGWLFELCPVHLKEAGVTEVVATQADGGEV